MPPWLNWLLPHIYDSIGCMYTSWHMLLLLCSSASTYTDCFSLISSLTPFSLSRPHSLSLLSLSLSFSASISLPLSSSFSHSLFLSESTRRKNIRRPLPIFAAALSGQNHRHIAGNFYFLSCILPLNDEKGFEIWCWIWFGICLLLSVMYLYLTKFWFSILCLCDDMQVDLVPTNISGFLASTWHS
jgi:hypothetical protein